MPLNQLVTKALRKAVKDAGQPEAVAKRLEAWLTTASDNAAALARADEVARSIENVLDAVAVQSDEEDGD